MNPVEAENAKRLANIRLPHGESGLVHSIATSMTVPSTKPTSGIPVLLRYLPTQIIVLTSNVCHITFQLTTVLPCVTSALVRTADWIDMSSIRTCHVSLSHWFIHMPHHHIRTVLMPRVTLPVVPHGTPILPNLLVSSIQQNAITFSYRVCLR